MREIKFRAWDSVNPKMAKVGILGLWEKFAWPHDRSFLHNSMDWSESEGLIVEPALMQFTGLKDKNGKEIYEGDVVFTNMDEEGYPINDLVVFEDGAFWIGEKFYNRELLRDYAEQSEVIGNIYENPELLK